jgi:hypothetical protein
MNTQSNESYELELFINNEREIYFSLVVPTRKALQRHFKRGTYDTDRAIIAWKRVSDRSAHIYAKTYDNECNWNTIFSVEDRKQTAIELEKYWHEEMKLGNFEH